MPCLSRSGALGDVLNQTLHLTAVAFRQSFSMRYRLRTLMILMAIGPPIVAPVVTEFQRWRKWREFIVSVDDPFPFESYFVWRKYEKFSEEFRR
jgi:hypothetical protein